MITIPNIVAISKIQNKSEYTGTPDKVIERKDNLTKGSEVKFNMFNGWVDYPIYKSLNELDNKDISKYNKRGIIYVYQPNHTRSDKWGMLKFKLVGATKKKNDKRILLIVEDLDKLAPFKHIYLEVNGDGSTDCGHVFNTTFDNWKGVNVGDEYKGYRNSKWIKLDPNDFINLTGKIYSNK
jgi:hypothetical protein